MERLFTFWRKYVTISPAARAFLKTHAEVKKFEKHAYFSRPFERHGYWCFVLEGLVAGYSIRDSGKRVIHWLVAPNHYFTGTKHSFSPHTEQHFIQFLHASKIVQVPISRLRYAQQHFPDVSELLQAMKQRKLIQKNQLLNIFKQGNNTQRYLAFRDTLPHLAEKLTVEQTLAYLDIGRTAYKIAHKAYLKRK